MVSCLIGLDIGGSRTRGRLAVDGQLVAEACGDSASWSAVGPDRARETLGDVIGRLRAATERAVDVVCAGAAGASVTRARDWLIATIAQLSGGARVIVVEDVALVLPAAGHTCGLAVICGTGSIVLGRDGPGAGSVRAGGFGYLLGDEAGGYWLVREALRVLLERRDRGEPPGPLHTALLGSRPLDDAFADLYADPRPRRWAALAPALLDEPRDAAIGELLSRGAAALAQTARTVTTRLSLDGGPIVLAGGLVAHPRVAEALTRALEDALPDWTVQTLAEPPVTGAVVLAGEVRMRP